MTPDLQAAVERLEKSHGLPYMGRCCHVHPEDLRLVLDALKEEPKRKWNNALVCAENAVFEVARSRKNKRTNEFKLPLQEIKAIRALAVDLSDSPKEPQ